MTYIVDRIEEGIAVLEDDDLGRREVPLKLLPPDIEEGSVLRLMEDGSFALDKEETNRRRKRLFNLQQNLFKK